MAKRKLPDRPPNGIGAGQTPRLVPRPLDVEGALATLRRPFKVPGMPARRAGSPEAAAHGRLLRDRSQTVTYAGLDVEAPAARGGAVRKDALSSRRLAEDPARLVQIECALRRSFTVPIRGYVQRHSLPRTLGTKKKAVLEPRPLHDPTDEFAIVLYDPSVDGDMVISDTSEAPLQELGANTQDAGDAKKSVHPRYLSNGLKNKSLRELLGEDEPGAARRRRFPNVPVVIDPRLAKILRPHQVEGVRFLYRCVTGLVMKDFLDQQAVASGAAAEVRDDVATNRGAYGCIMADEMGLGKTLQCIALMWTLLRQGPQGKRLIDKCIIVCPSSLVNNWANELVKWLGPGTLTPLAIDGKRSGGVSEAVRAWANAQGRNVVKPVLIISYETLRRNVEHLRNTRVGLMLADEGHRLKNADSLTFTSLDSIDCPRRVILSGTPIQNDLSEYFALLNFSNPGLLGTRADFRKNFENPILLSRDADATDDQIRKGDEQLQKLSYVVSKFIIRRTNDILSKYLPCKYEHVIFVKLRPFQRQLYERCVKSREITKMVKGHEAGTQPLKAIGLLKKLCNHPDLVDFEEDLENVDDLEIPEDYEIPTKSNSRRTVQTEFSGKFSILERFLGTIKSQSDDKIVLISNYTQTLDLIERLCRHKHYASLRLDGTMSINKRQKLVDRFNDPEGQEFIFLLSSKAGGCGINLIGANRLILMDPDWNPAADQQALARVWRDGQKKDCFIYRFISTGTIEEKIYQRQSMKMSLSSCVVDAKEDVERLFTTDSLRKLFKYNDKTICDTHETYHCKRCDPVTGKQAIRSPAMLYGDATTWNHLNHSALQKTNDHLLRDEFQHPDISYVFQYISH